LELVYFNLLSLFEVFNVAFFILAPMWNQQVVVVPSPSNVLAEVPNAFSMFSALYDDISGSIGGTSSISFPVPNAAQSSATGVSSRRFSSPISFFRDPFHELSEEEKNGHWMIESPVTLNLNLIGENGTKAEESLWSPFGSDNNNESPMSILESLATGYEQDISERANYVLNSAKNNYTEEFLMLSFDRRRRRDSTNELAQVGKALECVLNEALTKGQFAEGIHDIVDTDLLWAEETTSITDFCNEFFPEWAEVELNEDFHTLKQDFSTMDQNKPHFLKETNVFCDQQEEARQIPLPSLPNKQEEQNHHHHQQPEQQQQTKQDQSKKRFSKQRLSTKRTLVALCLHEKEKISDHVIASGQEEPSSLSYGHTTRLKGKKGGEREKRRIVTTSKETAKKSYEEKGSDSVYCEYHYDHNRRHYRSKCQVNQEKINGLSNSLTRKKKTRRKQKRQRKERSTMEDEIFRLEEILRLTATEEGDEEEEIDIM